MVGPPGQQDTSLVQSSFNLITKTKYAQEPVTSEREDEVTRQLGAVGTGTNKVVREGLSLPWHQREALGRWGLELALKR